MRAPVNANEPAKVTFVGPFNYANGLGVASRGYVAALMRTHLPANILPIEAPFYIHARVTPTRSSVEFVDRPDVALVHLNPDSWPALLSPGQRHVIDSAPVRVGAFVWDSQIIPARFFEQMRSLDAIWAPSRYCAEIFGRATSRPVYLVPYAVPIGAPISDSIRSIRLKRSLGIGEEHRIILYSFDATSYLTRKNPIALINAFDAARLAGSGWQLVLKTKHLSDANDDGRQLIQAAGRSSGVTVLNRVTSLDANRALLDAADVYASPHASEGFGLTVAEAMARGKVVVATNFSGTTDFLDATCGFPVAYRDWQLPRAEGPYSAGTIWGKIDEGDLTRTLSFVADLDPEARWAIGQRARQRIEEQLSPATVARRMRESIDNLVGRAAASGRHDQ